MCFDFQKFFSFILFFGGSVSLVIASTFALTNQDWLILLWLVPAVVCMAAGLAILD